MEARITMMLLFMFGCSAHQQPDENSSNYCAPYVIKYSEGMRRAWKRIDSYKIVNGCATIKYYSGGMDKMSEKIICGSFQIESNILCNDK